MSTSMAGAPAAGPGAGLARADIVRMGRSASPWHFVQLAQQALAIAPHDDEVRFLLACAYARLGLRSCAVGELDALAEQWRAAPPVVQVREQVMRLGEDRIPGSQLASACREHVEAWERELCVGTNLEPAALRASMEAWIHGLAAWSAHRTASGDVVVRHGDAWVLWEQSSEVVGAITKSFAEGKQPLVGFGVVVDGMHLPVAVREIGSYAGSLSEGVTTRWTFLCAGLEELFWGLAINELQGLLAGQMVEWVVGEDAPERLSRLLAGRLDGALPKLVTLPGAPRWTPGGRGRWDPQQPMQSVGGAILAQRDTTTQVMEQMRAIYASRTPAWYAERWTQIRVSAGKDPLRVLIFTSRYSTFVKHSAQDLADAFEDLGSAVRLHLEPDAATRFTAMSYARAIAEHRPDLIVAINTPRANLGKFVPAQVPFVCWVQDSMPYLFDKQIGASQTPMDFVVGHYFPAMYKDFGYDIRNFLHTPVVASTRKFHAGPVDAARRERYACDIAYISHHSATPAELRDSLRAKAMASPDNAMVPIIDAVYEPLMRLAARTIDEGPIHDEIVPLCERIVTRLLGEAPSAELMAKVQYAIALPLVDRAIRHRVVGWMTSIAQRRGWKLHLYGRGWEKAPAYRAWAKPELTHDEDLRAAYQCAGVSVHASVHGLMHQRVLECALSGGLPIGFLKREDLIALQRSVLARATADGLLPAVTSMYITEEASYRGEMYCIASDHPETMMLDAIWTRMGMGPCGLRWAKEVARASECERKAMVLGREVVWLMGDLDQTTFFNEQRLEALVASARERPRWRENLSVGIRERVHKSLTSTWLARQMIGLCEGVGKPREAIA